MKIDDEFNKKYDGIAKADAVFKQKMPAFEKSNDTYIPEVFEKAAKKLGVKYEINSFHAGAETHIYCQHKNAKGENFIPFLLGLADLYNMHSADEKIDYKSFLKGYELLLNDIENYNIKYDILSSLDTDFTKEREYLNSYKDKENYDALETILKKYEDNGYDYNKFAKNPIEAIFLWNKNVANDYNEIAKEKIKIIKKIIK